MDDNNDGIVSDLETALASPLVWEAEAPAPRHFVGNIVAFAARLREEEENARGLCDEILTGPAEWWPQRLRTTQGTDTAGMVRELLERMRQMLERSPAKALQITTLAIDIADALAINAYPSDYAIKLRAQAFRDHAYVLSFMGRFPDALDYADRARRLFEQVPLPEYDLARLGLVRASILRCVDRVDEAIQLVREAAETLHRYGDADRYTAARIWEANCIFETGAYAEALAIYDSLVDEPAIDAVSRLRLMHNSALCHVQQGQIDVAAAYLTRCSAEFDLLGMHTERTRSRSALGEALLATGRANAAVPVLRQAWREFENLDMLADAALAALQLAEALLVDGEGSEVAVICRDLIARFTAAGMTSKAITALSFLREAVAIGQATPSLVRHVFHFLRELPAKQHRVYAPPSGSTAD